MKQNHFFGETFVEGSEQCCRLQAVKNLKQKLTQIKYQNVIMLNNITRVRQAKAEMLLVNRPFENFGL
jgi:hypothetical protein